MKLRAPKLSLEQNLMWTVVRNAWCEAGTFRTLHGLKKHTDVGVELLKHINAVLKSLGRFYDGPTTFNKEDPKAGDEKAFEEFFLKMQKNTTMPRAATSVVM